MSIELTRYGEAGGRPGLGSIVGSVAAVVAEEHFPSGDRAALRRMQPAIPPPLSFYRFAFRHLPDGWEGQRAQWMTIVGGISLMSPDAHRRDLPAGRALAEARFSEGRLERLLAAEGNALLTLVLRAARYLRAKAQPMDWTDFAALVLSTEGEKREQCRLRIARDYYRALRAKE